jgi:hypothetical protein
MMIGDALRYHFHKSSAPYCLLKSTSERLLIGLQMTTHNPMNQFTESRPSSEPRQPGSCKAMDASLLASFLIPT